MKIRTELLGGAIVDKLEKEWINCHSSTSYNATGVVWVSKEAENSNNAGSFGLVRFFLPKPEKTSKNCYKMDVFLLIFWLLKDFYTLAGK